ncbi:phospholipase D family protein [Natrarchaeobaculum aegyptiacum]|uniref:NgoFVII family restriction endonuclease n=1 Tax=Natrarchaeobaculum aegyptiacum TaxID=745377 RepID=A0A2Z2HUG6_9EURY|nr:phospholipase D family protein [Natrarchaeobaculum aegyptiacum]ARS89147.1 NgoFVII family restriction endonuclease [Natrarchaeobaculum aegyptiacum]
MTDVIAEPSVRLLDTDHSDIRFQEALADLFAEDGTIYIVSGYFTYQGYLAIRDDIVSFLERSRDNELITVVSPASDQFSPRIAHDLWSLDEHDQVQIYKQPRGLHAKLYIREGPNPTCLIGSANITQVAFRYNIEINVEITRESIDHPDLQPFHEWILELVETSDPLRRRDLLPPYQVGGSVANWSNKARYLPKRNVALRAIPVLLLLVFFSGMFSLLLSLI